MAKIDEMLRLMVEKDASDLHIYSGKAPGSPGERQPHPTGAWAGENIRTGSEKAAPRNSRRGAASHHRERLTDLDFSYHIHGVSRFRANDLFQQSGMSAVFRRIPEKIASLDALGMPPVLKKLTLLKKGLVLVTGPTGSGKSATLASDDL